MLKVIIRTHTDTPYDCFIWTTEMVDNNARHCSIRHSPKTVELIAVENSRVRYLVRSSWPMTLTRSEWRWLTDQRPSDVPSTTYAANSTSSRALCASSNSTDNVFDVTVCRRKKSRLKLFHIPGFPLANVYMPISVDFAEMGNWKSSLLPLIRYQLLVTDTWEIVIENYNYSGK